jgi:exoribonuclease II
MAELKLYQDNLVLYKNRPARVTLVDSKKIEIEVEGGQRLSVRPKDVILLHPGPIRTLTDLTTPSGDMITAWELLAGETTTLPELADLAYGAYTPASAWSLWQMITDGLYFSGTTDAVVTHSAEEVAAMQAARTAKAAEENAWNHFVARLADQRHDPEDKHYLEDIANFALGQHERSRVLRALGRVETAQNAHALLLSLGYWDATINPYPARFRLPESAPAIDLPALPDEERRDLTHLVALAIDDEGNQDPDDALSFDNGRLWVHIADVASLIAPGSPADHEARARGGNLYLPEGTVPMLPTAVTRQLGLGLNELSPALSFRLELDETGGITGLEIVPSLVRVTRLSYEVADQRLDEPLLANLYRLAQRYQARRRAQGAIELDLPEVKVRVEHGRVQVRPLPSLRSRDLVREAMLMTGEAVGRFALENGIPLPFTSQDAPETVPPLATLSQMFAARRLMKPGQQKSKPAPHAGLGLELYVQCTSPLRRYLDLVVHQQLRAHVRGQTLLDSKEIMERVAALDAVAGDVRRAERLSVTHWILVYLQQQPEWQGDAIVVEKRGARDLLIIPDLALETQLYQRHQVPLDAVVRVMLEKVNLPDLEATFRLAREQP